MRRMMVDQRLIREIRQSTKSFWFVITFYVIRDWTIETFDVCCPRQFHFPRLTVPYSFGNSMSDCMLILCLIICIVRWRFHSEKSLDDHFPIKRDLVKHGWTFPQKSGERRFLSTNETKPSRAACNYAMTIKFINKFQWYYGKTE